MFIYINIIMIGLLGQLFQLSDSSTLFYSITICSQSPKHSALGFAAAMIPWLSVGLNTTRQVSQPNSST